MDNPQRNQRETQRWLPWAMVAVLLAVACALRWHYMQTISLFVDEFVTAWAARNVAARGVPVFPSGNIYPHGLVFTYLDVPFVLGSFDEVRVRVPALIISLITIVVVYWVGRRLFSKRVGLVAAAAMAVDPACITWGGRARMYGLLQLLCLLVVFVYYRSLIGDRVRDRYLAMGLLVLAIFTHAQAAFLLPALGLATLIAWPWRRLFRWRFIVPWMLGGFGAVAFFLIARFGQPGHLETLQESRPYLALATDILSGPLAFAPVFTSTHRLPFTLLALAGLAAIARSKVSRQSITVYLYVIFLAFVFLLVFLAGGTWQRERYLFLILPLLFLLAGAALDGFGARVLPRHWQRPWLLVILVTATALFVGAIGSASAYVQEWGYDGAFRYLRDEFQPQEGDRLVTSMSTAAMLYLGQNDAFVIQQGYEEYLVPQGKEGALVDLWTATPVLTQTAEFVDLLQTAPRVWFVVDGWRLQTRYEPEFIFTVHDQMSMVYNERGVMVFQSDGYDPAPEPAIEIDREVDFDGQLGLTGFGLSSIQPQPGEEVDVTLYWRALGEVGPAYTALVHLVASDGSGLVGVDEQVLDGLYQPDLWPADLVVPDRHRLLLPGDLAPGRYRLDVGLYPPGQPEALLPIKSDGNEGGRLRLPLAMLTVGYAGRTLSPDRTVATDFGPIRLLGYRLQAAVDGDPQTWNLILYWQAREPVDRDYTVFVHVMREGDRVAQSDGVPGNPFFPTTTWLPGTTIEDVKVIVLPAGVASEEVMIRVGLYYQPTGERLPASDAQGQPLGDALPLYWATQDGEQP